MFLFVMNPSLQQLMEIEINHFTYVLGKEGNNAINAHTTVIPRTSFIQMFRKNSLSSAFSNNSFSFL